MKLFIIATTLVSLAASVDTPCGTNVSPGDRFCSSYMGKGPILYCNNRWLGVPIIDCPGRCVHDDRGQAYCEYRGWDDTCEGGPEYNNWCEKDGGPSGIRVCEDKRFPVLYLCDGVCDSNGGHAICRPEGSRDKCPDGVKTGQSVCDVPNGPGKIRKCQSWGKFEVVDKCKDICAPFPGSASCINRLD